MDRPLISLRVRKSGSAAVRVAIDCMKLPAPVRFGMLATAVTTCRVASATSAA